MKTILREEMINWFIESVDCEDAHFFPRDKARYLTNSILSLPSLRELVEKAEKWDAYQAELANEKTHTDRFITLMAAEEAELRRDAEKWRKVEEIAKQHTHGECRTCNVFDHCHDFGTSLCWCARRVVESIEVPHEG